MEWSSEVDSDVLWILMPQRLHGDKRLGCSARASLAEVARIVTQNPSKKFCRKMRQRHSGWSERNGWPRTNMEFHGSPERRKLPDQRPFLFRCCPFGPLRVEPMLH